MKTACCGCDLTLACGCCACHFLQQVTTIDGVQLKGWHLLPAGEMGREVSDGSLVSCHGVRRFS